MSLYNQQLPGTGATIALLHGWGLNGSLLEPLAEKLGDEWRRLLFDLPGHGQSLMTDLPYNAENLAHLIAEQLPENCILLGWSLGGMLAQQITLDFPDKVAKLILIASTPRFVQGPEWPHATSSKVLENFCQELNQDYESVLQRFLLLQAKGSANAKHEIRFLREQLFAHGKPDPAALQGGMEILAQFDLRDQLAMITQPTLLIMGKRDTLMPNPVGEVFQQQLPNAKLVTIESAGHAPFLSHPTETIDAIKGFLREKH